MSDYLKVLTKPSTCQWWSGLTNAFGLDRQAAGLIDTFDCVANKGMIVQPLVVGSTAPRSAQPDCPANDLSVTFDVSKNLPPWLKSSARLV